MRGMQNVYLCAQAGCLGCVRDLFTAKFKLFFKNPEFFADFVFHINTLSFVF